MAGPAAVRVRADGAAEGHAHATAAGLRRVLLNGLALLGAYVLPRLFTFAAAVVAARALGVATFGLYGTVAALAVILSIVSTLGMMQLLVREIARSPERAAELVGAAHVAKAVSGLVMMGALAGLAAGLLGDVPEAVLAALLLGAAYALGSFVENLGAYVQAVERMGAWMQAQALFGIVSGGLGIALVLATGSLAWFCAAPLVGQAVALTWLMSRTPPPVRWAWRAPRPRVVGLLIELVPFTLSTIALTAYYKIDVLLVEQWRGAAEAGVYAAAYKFVDVAQALALVVAMAVYPRLSRAAAEVLDGGAAEPGADRAGGAARRRWAATRVAELLLLASVPAAGVLWLTRGPVVDLLFGQAYAASAGVVAILAPVLPLLALNALGAYILAAAERMGLVAAVFSGALVLNVGLNAALVPGLGARGAALAMLASESALAIAMLAALRRHASAAPSRRVVGAALLAAGAAAMMAWPTLPALGAAAAYLGAAAAVYAAARVVPVGEWRLLRRAVVG
ncbi:MAG: oligosaccharide flippase family protein [Gemmatimonadetes bacterium]|nr:oligosaccharide flippase family protein [Gemmatimonadota bacterium]